MCTLDDKISEALKNLRSRTEGPYIDIGDWDKLLDILDVALCNHEWEAKSSLDTPYDPVELYSVCKRCKAEK